MKTSIKKSLFDAIQKHNLDERVVKSGAEWRCYEKTRRALSKQRPTLLDRLAFGRDLLLHPNAVKRAISYARSSRAGGARRYAVVAFSDIHGNLGEQMRWGDFWVKQSMIEAITAQGGIVVDPFMNPDVMIHLFGGYYDLPPAGEHVLWVHSHPEKLSRKFLASYDRAYSISRQVCAAMREMGAAAEWLPMATGKLPRRAPDAPVDERVVFVGNALPNLKGHRRVVDDMLAVTAQNPQIRFTLWGGLFKDLPDGVLAGTYLPFHELDELYAGNAIVLNDHRPEMREQGLINPRILDVLASGGFVISDRNNAIEEYLGDAVPQYDTPEELAALLDTYLNHPERRREKTAAACERAREYTWARVAKGLMGGG